VFEENRIAVVVPAHNEEAFIASTVRSVPDFVDVIIVVDDASSDGTVRQVEELADPRAELVRNPTNLGVGGATIAGFRRALELGADIVVKMDGDGQMPPEHVHDLLEAIVHRGYDYAKGNRFLRPDALQAMPRRRLLANMLMTFLTKIASGYWHIFDPQNGFIAIRSTHLQRLDLARIDARYFFENDMLIQLYLLAARVCDVGMPARYGAEVSGVRPLQIAVRFPPRLIRAFLRRIYIRYVLVDFSPVALFLGLGALSFLWGAGFGIYLWVRALTTLHLTPTGTIMLALLPLIMGFQMVLQGIVLDIQETPR
jgi:glycosyltransferase involved in cell wall biosynthesis